MSLNITVKYNDNVIDTWLQQGTSINILYDNKSITTLSGDGSIILNTYNKICKGLIVVGNRALNTLGKHLSNNITIISEVADWDTNPGTLNQLSTDFNWEEDA